MSEAVSRAVVEAFYRAYGTRDIERAGEFIADDVVWTIGGPVGLLPFCGTYRGKTAVLDMMCGLAPQVLDVVRCETITTLVDGDRVAALNRLTARHKCEGRMISFRLAHFMRFRDGKVAENLSLLDSFDAVEQMLGHPLAADERECPADDLVAV